MRKLLSVTIIASSLFLASQASALTVVNANATRGALDLRVLQAGDNLQHGGAFASTGGAPVAYLFDEGMDASNDLSFLLHFDLAANQTFGRVAGSFEFNLAPTDTFIGLYATSQGLLATDNLADGALYQRASSGAAGLVTAGRGLEGVSTAVTNDSVRMVQTSASTYLVTYDLRDTGTTMDEVRFVFDPPPAAAPEPASWALMLGGFGLAGAAFRRRQGVQAA